MKRITVAAAACFAMLGLMFRGLSLESEAAHTATNGSVPLDTVDGVWQSIGYAGGTALPIGLLVAVVAMVLAVIVVASGGR